MTELVKLLVNGETVLEYNKNVELAENQRAYIDDMDQMMDKGIELGGESIAKPELKQVEAKYERSVLGIEFIFDQDHLNWQKIELSGLKH